MRLLFLFLFVLAGFEALSYTFLSGTDSLISVKGRVMDSTNQTPLVARLVFEKMPTGDEVRIANSQDHSGEYELKLLANKLYSVQIDAEGYFSYKAEIKITTGYQNVLNHDFLLVPNPVSGVIRLEKLTFDQSNAEVPESAYAELNKIAKLLGENPAVIIQLEGHTDFRGNNELNLKLSEERVEAVRDYLVSQGISKSRIKVKAFGGANPLHMANTEEAKKMNRRVEIRILKNE